MTSPKSTKKEKSICCFCRLPRAERDCGVCHEPICRSCVQRLGEDTFSMLAKVPAELSHSEYCPRCFDAHVEPAKTAYDETLERAKKVGFWAKAYRGNVPVLKKSREEIAVEHGRDRDEVLLKLGFMAAELGFNGLIQGELVGRKVRHNDDRGYQTMKWSGKAVPAMVDEGKIEREEFREAHWRVLHHR